MNQKAKKRLLTLYLQSKLISNKSLGQPKKKKEALPSHHFKQLLFQTHLEQCLQDDLSIGPHPSPASFLYLPNEWLVHKTKWEELGFNLGQFIAF